MYHGSGSAGLEASSRFMARLPAAADEDASNRAMRRSSTITSLAAIGPDSRRLLVGQIRVRRCAAAMLLLAISFGLGSNELKEYLAKLRTSGS